MSTPKQEALQELRDIQSTASQEGFPQPTPEAMKTARALIGIMNKAAPEHRYDVYPSEDGEVVIDAGSPEERLVMFCYPDGHILCLGREMGKRIRLRADRPDEILPDFIERTLNHPEPTEAGNQPEKE